MEYFFNFEKMTYIQGSKPDGCILCLVNSGSGAVTDLRVHATRHFVVCVNLYPYNPGHLMIFPRRHIEDLREYEPAEAAELQDLTARVLDVLDGLYHPAAYNLGYNMGLIAGASIRHLHLHLIPRYPNELGMADLLAGKRVLVEGPFETAQRLSQAFKDLAAQ